MRMQILPLPQVSVDDYSRSPFALVVDQAVELADNPHEAQSDTELRQFAADCGASTLLITAHTVEVVR